MGTPLVEVLRTDASRAADIELRRDTSGLGSVHEINNHLGLDTGKHCHNHDIPDIHRHKPRSTLV